MLGTLKGLRTARHVLLDGGRRAAYRHLVDEFADRAAGKPRLLLEAGARAGIANPTLMRPLDSRALSTNAAKRAQWRAHPRELPLKVRN